MLCGDSQIGFHVLIPSGNLRRQQGNRPEIGEFVPRAEHIGGCRRGFGDSSFHPQQ